MRTNSIPKSSYPPLQTVCKDRFPFTIACPSFVYPAGYVENVRCLAPFVNEIQLLFFESAPQSLPSPTLVRELADLAESEQVGYNVHLPTDVFLGHPDPQERQRAVETLRTVVRRCQVLAPSGYTLHLEPNPASTEKLPTDRWHQYLLESLARILPQDVPPPTICVENLDYPFEWVAPVIAAADLSICMDMGHLMVQGIDLEAFYAHWKARITTIHLHGVDGTEDHLPLDSLSDGKWKKGMGILKRFTGVVVIENYSLSALNASLACLADRWPRLTSKGG